MADEEIDFSVCAVLPAAGSGLRTGLETPKQYNLILGRPLISYTIEAFERVSWIQRIVVSVSKENQLEMEEIVRDFNHTKVKITLGGITRHRSIFNGVKELSSGNSQPPDVVIIHDAVRPFVDEDILKKVALAARKHGASGAVRPLVSTVIAVNNEGLLDHSLERSKYRASEMPQAFRFDAIYGAYMKCTDYDLEYGTECLHLAQRYSGVQAMLVDGPDSLWKVTFKKDLFAAESFLKGMTKLKAMIIGSLDSNFEKELMLKLKSQDIEVCQSSWQEIKTLAEPSCNVIIAVNRHHDQLCPPSEVQDNEHSHKPSSECLDCFSKDLFKLFTTAIQKRTIVAVHLSDNKHDIDVFKEKLKELYYHCNSSRIQCYGIFISTASCYQGNLPSSDCEKIITMTLDVALNTSDVLSGQVFQYLW